ncbi:MAG TPA: PH domain-containing protein [Microbacteriaceae bacterium]|nr:PH domain-containing protein [Microbacteriaceae bacterium]
MADVHDTAPIEHIIVRLRPRGTFLAVSALLVIADAAAVGYLAGRMGVWWHEVVLWLAGAALVVLFALAPLLAWLSRRYTVTSRRVIVQRGLVVRVRQELLHTRGYDVTLSRSWFQALTGCGDVGINSGLSQPVWLRGVPDARRVQMLLQDLAESNRSFVADRRRAADAGGPDVTTAWGVR